MITIKNTQTLMDFDAWSGAVETKETIIENRKAQQFDDLIDELYPEGLTETELNDILWFETDWIYDMLKIREIWKDIPYFNSDIDEQIEINAHYKGYLKKQKADILAFKRDENLLIPEKINYDNLSGLSNEVKAKFKEIKPKTMGQALRIDGITPAAVYILLSHVKRKSIKQIA